MVAMKKTETLLIVLSMFAAAGAGVAYWRRDNIPVVPVVANSAYGAYLAAQHAIYVNDFDRAADFTAQLADVDNQLVRGARYLAEFLSGRLPDATTLGDDKSTSARMIYDTDLVVNDKWQELYNRYKKDDTALHVPIRIAATIAVDRYTEALNFVKKSKSNESWKSFIRGMIYAEWGKPDEAGAEFANVRSEFMNINDYLYMMSFYMHNGFTDKADDLRADFTSRPGGMFMLKYTDVPAWETFSGPKNALAFSLVQTVSHTQIMMFTDLSILFLRTAQIIGGGADTDTINYYLGQYFFNNNGDYERFFAAISENSPFYPFARLRLADGNARALSRVVSENTLFVPALDAVVAQNVAAGNRRRALRAVNRALRDRDLTEQGRAFFLKRRAQIYLTFGDAAAAARDIDDVAVVFPFDAETMAIQAQTWVLQNKNIDTAHDYAMTLIKRDPTDISAWNTLGRVMIVRDGLDTTLELIERVGASANSCSALFELLGDLYVRAGENSRARDAYTRAIDLSGDGLVIVSQIQKKIRKLK